MLSSFAQTLPLLTQRLQREACELSKRDAGDYSLAKLIVSAPKADIDFDAVRDRSDTGRDQPLLRVVDDSGEDYVYLTSRFMLEA